MIQLTIDNSGKKITDAQKFIIVLRATVVNVLMFQFLLFLTDTTSDFNIVRRSPASVRFCVVSVSFITALFIELWKISISSKRKYSEDKTVVRNLTLTMLLSLCFSLFYTCVRTDKWVQTSTVWSFLQSMSLQWFVINLFSMFSSDAASKGLSNGVFRLVNAIENAFITEDEEYEK